MDDITSNVTNDANTKIKDGYTQLAEKMDQVKNQVARMERKYDELYQAVKEKDMAKPGSLSHESPSESHPQEVKTLRDSVITQSATKQIVQSDDSSKFSEPRQDSSGGQQPSSPPSADMDIEKMEDNPFV